MTNEERIALREAAQTVIDTQGHDPECHAYTRMMAGIHPAAVLELLDECERMRKALAYYADTFCELDKGHECCGKLGEDECGGCKARAALGDGA